MEPAVLIDSLLKIKNNNIEHKQSEIIVSQKAVFPHMKGKDMVLDRSHCQFFLKNHNIRALLDQSEYNERVKRRFVAARPIAKQAAYQKEVNKDKTIGGSIARLVNTIIILLKFDMLLLASISFKKEPVF